MAQPADLPFDPRRASYEQLRSDLLPILTGYRDVEGALLPILHEAQARYGWISEAAVRVIADFLRITPPQVYEVATYYHELTTEPPADVRVTLCAGPACRIGGGPDVQAAVQEATGISVGDTRRDFKYALGTSACLGVCFHAPAVGLNHRVVGRVAPSQVSVLLTEAEREAHHGGIPGVL